MGKRPRSKPATGMDAEKAAKLDAMWQARTKRRGSTLEMDLGKTREMLESLETKAAERQEIETKVTGTMRRASVIADPQRVAESIEELEESAAADAEAVNAVNESWTKRLNRRSSLLEDIATTKSLLDGMLEVSPEDADGQIQVCQDLLGKMQASDENEQEAIQMLQEMWACQDARNPTFAEDMEMTKALLTTVEEQRIAREKASESLAEKMGSYSCDTLN